MRHGYLRPDESAVTNAENALRSKGTDDLARLVEDRGRTFDSVIEEAGVEINFDSVKTLGGTNDEKRDKLSQVIAERTAASNIIKERQEIEQAEAENNEANERLEDYRRGPRLFTPEQVREIAAGGQQSNALPQSTRLAEAIGNHFGDGADFVNRFGAPFAFSTEVELSSFIREPVNVITAANTMRTGSGNTGAQANVGFLRFPPLQDDVEYFPRRMVSVFQFLSRNARTIPMGAGGAYRYSAEVAPTGTAPAFRAEASALSQRKFQTEIRTTNLQICGSWVPVSREEFLDVQGFSMFLNNVLRDDVLLSVDQALLTGNGNAPNILGLEQIQNVQTVDMAPGSGVTFFGTTLVHQAMSEAFSQGHTISDFIVMNPADWHETRTFRDTEERLTVGSELVDVRPSLFGLPVIQTPAATENTVFVGASSKLQVIQQGGVQVEWTNAHDDGFSKLIDAVRGYCRIGLVSRRDVGQAKVTNYAAKTTG